jgi:hypothetical protein
MEAEAVTATCQRLTVSGATIKAPEGGGTIEGKQASRQAGKLSKAGKGAPQSKRPRQAGNATCHMPPAQAPVPEGQSAY